MSTHNISLYGKMIEFFIKYTLHCLDNFVDFVMMWLKYRNDTKFSDRLVLANSADPDQTAPGGAV